MEEIEQTETETTRTSAAITATANDTTNTTNNNTTPLSTKRKIEDEDDENDLEKLRADSIDKSTITTTGKIGAEGEEDELSLPRATVYKLITELLPKGVLCPKETRDLLITCCVEFIHLVSGEANEVCERSGKKTITPDHLVEALRRLGFGEYVGEVEACQEDVTAQVKERGRARSQSKLEQSGLTEEELLRQQEELFEQARRRYLESQTSTPKMGTNTAMIEEETGFGEESRKADQTNNLKADTSDGDDLTEEIVESGTE